MTVVKYSIEVSPDNDGKLQLLSVQDGTSVEDILKSIVAAVLRRRTVNLSYETLQDKILAYIGKRESVTHSDLLHAMQWHAAASRVNSDIAELIADTKITMTREKSGGNRHNKIYTLTST